MQYDEQTIKDAKQLYQMLMLAGFKVVRSCKSCSRNLPGELYSFDRCPYCMERLAKTHAQDATS